VRRRYAAGHSAIFGIAWGEQRNDSRAFKDLPTRAKIRLDVRLHDLRHTAASLLLAQGVPGPGRHGSSGTFADRHHRNTCSHVMPTQLTTAADAINDALWG
jgi:integrase